MSSRADEETGKRLMTERTGAIRAVDVRSWGLCVGEGSEGVCARNPMVGIDFSALGQVAIE